MQGYGGKAVVARVVTSAKSDFNYLPPHYSLALPYLKKFLLLKFSGLVPVLTVWDWLMIKLMMTCDTMISLMVSHSSHAPTYIAKTHVNATTDQFTVSAAILKNSQSMTARGYCCYCLEPCTKTNHIAIKGFVKRAKQENVFELVVY